MGVLKGTLQSLYAFLAGQPANSAKRSASNRDLLLVWLITILTYVLAFFFDLHNLVDRWAGYIEQWDLNQVVVPTVVFTICIVWFAYRRWLDSENEGAKLKVAEEALRYRVIELETLRQASLKLTSSLSLAEVLVVILEYARELLQADNGHIFSYKESELQFEIAFWEGAYRTQPFPRLRIEEFATAIVHSKQMIVVSDMRHHPVYNDWDLAGAIVGIPLCIGEAVCGLMSLSFNQVHTFNANELRILALLADQAAIAMQNANLHQQVQQQATDLEQRVQERTAELLEANEELSQYAYVVSHDLQTPLRGMRNYADFLHEDLQETLQPEQQEYLNGLIGAVNQAEELINGLLLLSQLGGRDLPKGVVPMGSFLRKLVDSLALPDDVEVVLTAVDWPTLYSEKTLLRQIFQNLILNGVKFNQSPQKRIELGGQPDGSAAYRFSVRDNGIGIDGRYQDKIFGVFERLHTVNDYEGTGLGLALVRKAARKLGGNVWVESEPGQGTVFYVVLPVP